MDNTAVENSPDQTDGSRLEHLTAQFERSLENLRSAPAFAKVNHQGRLFDVAIRMLKQPGGWDVLDRYAPELEDAGAFHGGDWAHPAKLVPQRVPHALSADAYHIALEVLSELRFLAIAEGRVQHPGLEAPEARAFLAEALAWNLDLLFPESDEAGRAGEVELRAAVIAHLQALAGRVGLDSVLDEIVSEAERILAQRPIVVLRVVTMLRATERALADHPGNQVHERARYLLDALLGPTEWSRQSADAAEYAALLSGPDTNTDILAGEARGFAQSMYRTGLVGEKHAALLRHLCAKGDVALLARALGLDDVGRTTLLAYQELVLKLIDMAIFPETAQAIDGLAALLNDARLYSRTVSLGLWRLTQAPMDETVMEELQSAFPSGAGEATALGILVSGALSVLGRPRGVGQGDNPTCQSARAISLWSQVNPGFLLEALRAVARDHNLLMYFEGAPIESMALTNGLIEELHTDLDPVSLVLVPHLDRIYWEMGRRIVDRGEDGHKWINPEFHGWWVQRGFATAIDYATGAVKQFEEFLRTFYAAYHPLYNGGRALVYPQPAGVAVTDLHGRFVGWHAVAIERVALDEQSTMRVYFYNPNNDGGQDWGKGVVTSTAGCGELPGEASLPIDQFAGRLYLFHYEPRELGDPDLVPADIVAGVQQAAHESWARELAWQPATAPAPPSGI